MVIGELSLSLSVCLHLSSYAYGDVACRSVHTCIVEPWRGRWAVSSGLSLFVSLRLVFAVGLAGGRLRRSVGRVAGRTVAYPA